MKASMKVNSKVIVEAEGETVADVFANLARLADVLGAAQKCGWCGSEQIQPRVRDAKGFRFFELTCMEPKCGARFSFGQLKEPKGALFPKRKDDQGNLLPNGGWSIWQGDQSRPVQGRSPGDDSEPIPY